jgi:MFS family permease
MDSTDQVVTGPQVTTGPQVVTGPQVATEPQEVAGPQAVAEPQADAGPAGPVPLRRNRNFQLLWTGSIVGRLGIEVADIGYPLAILALTGSPGLAGLFGFAQTLAGVLAALPAGDLVDRTDRRRVMLAAEGTRAVAAGSVAVALALHHLTIGHLVAVAVLLGAAGAFGAPARMLLVRAAVPDRQLTAALTREQVRDNVAALGGPPLGGILYGVRQALPFAFSTVTFALSLVSALLIRLPLAKRRPETVARQANPAADGFARRMTVGLRLLWRDPMLRAVMVLLMAVNTVGAPLLLIAVVVLRGQGTPPALIGVATSGAAIGGLLGAGLVGRLHRLRPGRLLLLVVLVLVPMLALFAVPLGPFWVMGLLCVAMLGVPAIHVLLDVLVFRQVPDDQRGRVITACMTLLEIGMPLGTAAGGLLLQYLNPAAAVLVLAGLLAAVLGYAVFQPALRAARWPAAIPPATVDSPE